MKKLRVVVTGSLGNVGKPLTQTLVEHGHQVTVISSKEDKKQEIRSLGANSAVGSVEDVEFLTNTFKDNDAVYLMIPPNWTGVDAVTWFGTVTDKYVQAIQKTSVKRVVHLSSWGTHPSGMMNMAKKSEEILNQLPSDIAVTHLRATSFYTNLYMSVPSIKAAGVINNNYGGSDVQVLVHPNDIADVAVEELEKEGAEGKQWRYVSSDERTCDDIAKVLGEAIGKPELKWPRLTDEEYTSLLQKRNTPQHMIDRLVSIGASAHNGTMKEHYMQNRPTLGKIKLEQFAQEFAAAYNK